MSTTSPNNSDGGYVLGQPPAQQQGYASFETKPTSQLSDRRSDTGGGYERWRSYEDRPDSSRIGKEDVYVTVHRLAAVAFCYPDDMAVGDILAHLDGRDVHHTTGCEWANFGESPNFEEKGLEVVGHGTHSEITQSQMRAWAADSKRKAQEQMSASGFADDSDDGLCVSCGESEAMATVESAPGEYCLECVREIADGETIEVL